MRKLFQGLFEEMGYVDDGDFDWSGRSMQTPVNSTQTNQEASHGATRERHRSGKDKSNTGTRKVGGWSESKPSGMDGLGMKSSQENRHPSIQVVKGSATNIDISRDDDGVTADRSNAPIALGTADFEVVDETNCCCFFKSKIKRQAGRNQLNR